MKAAAHTPRSASSSDRRPATFGKLRESVVALPLAVFLVATPASSQFITGRVVNASSGEPVAGVTITPVDALAAMQGAVTSNKTGKFIIVIMSPGTYHLRATRIGYADTVTPPVEIGDGEVVEVEWRLDVRAVEVEAFTVVDRRRATQRERDVHGYYERVEQSGEPHLGPTQIYTRESLEGWGPLTLEELFREDYIRWGPYRRSCDPKAFLDGKARHGRFLEDLGSMWVSNIEGIELYAGPGPEHSRFHDPGGCGVVLVWTPLLREGTSELNALDVALLAGGAVLLLVLGGSLIF
jgi:hypothetical protein